MIDPDGKHLLLYRSDHPQFGNDADIPGGIVEDGESMVEAMLREVVEEAGVEIDPGDVREVYSGSEYSKHGTQCTLYIARLNNRPEIVMSWEHSAYEWLDKEVFLQKAKSANDTYMHMVHDVVCRS